MLGWRHLTPGFCSVAAYYASSDLPCIFVTTLACSQECNKSLALTYFLLVYYGPGVTPAMYVHIHIQLFHTGLFSIESFHTELLHTELLHIETHIELLHKERLHNNLFIIAETNLRRSRNACSMERWLGSSGMIKNRLSYCSVVFIEWHLRYRDVL